MMSKYIVVWQEIKRTKEYKNTINLEGKANFGINKIQKRDRGRLIKKH